MAKTRPVRWLHLSDLHMGGRGKDLWWQVNAELEASVREMVARLGPPDLLLLTGDLANTGAPAEYELVDRFLDDLLAWLREAGSGSEPLLVAVPGNHDVQRPAEGQFRRACSVLRAYGASELNSDVEDLVRELWERRDASSIDPLFLAYRAWFERRIRPRLEAHSEHRAFSHIPCDFSVVVHARGSFPLLLVGLNSTWQQYDGGEFEGRLTVPAQQIQAALGADAGTSPLENLKRTPRALLLQHHPPSWLSPEGHRTYEESIYPAGRFDLCLHGHLHHGRSQWASISGGVPRCFFRSPSLFGLEQYGTAMQRAAFGYTWGSLAEDGTVRIWPFRRVRRGDGSWVFDRDQEFAGDAEGVVIGGPIGGSTRARSAPAEDLGPYLRELVKRTDHLVVS